MDNLSNHILSFCPKCLSKNVAVYWPTYKSNPGADCGHCGFSTTAIRWNQLGNQIKDQPSPDDSQIDQMKILSNALKAGGVKASDAGKRLQEMMLSIPDDIWTMMDDEMRKRGIK